VVCDVLAKWLPRDDHGNIDGGIDVIQLCSAPSPQEVDDMTLSSRDFFLPSGVDTVE